MERDTMKRGDKREMGRRERNDGRKEASYRDSSVTVVVPEVPSRRTN